MTTSPSLPLSLEFFPPKTPEGAAKLAVVRQELYALNPQFCSVTYGAGGTTQDGTLAAVQAILDEGQQGASHFTCVGATRESVRERLAQFRAMGMRRIVALRGDLPSGYGQMGEFRYASDLVAFIRAETGDHFHIEVAAYPETHPQARSPQADLQAFAAKVQAGADSAITQFFFNPEAYFHFVDDVRKRGVEVPIVPGIMPFHNFANIARISARDGIDIPRWVALKMEGFMDDTASIRAFGLDVVTRLCERLVEGGAPALHFYTLNQSALVLEICRRLQLAV